MSELRKGDAGPKFELEDINRTMLVRYAGASGDMNPMHVDEAAAQAVGYPSVFAHGMFTAGVAAHYLTQWLGAENLRRYKVRFRKQVWPGDTLTFASEVTDRYHDADGDEDRVDIDLVVTNQDGVTVLEGAATFGLGRARVMYR